MIILNTPEVIQSLFIQRANIYSGRPVPYLIRNMIPPDSELILVTQNDAQLRKTRTALRVLTSPIGLKDALPMQDRIASKLVSHLRENTYSAATAIGLWSFEIALTASMGPVGVETTKPDIFHRWIHRVHEVLDMLESVESFLYEILPAIRYLPASPGKRLAKSLGESAAEFYRSCVLSLKLHMSHADETGEDVAYWGLIATILRNQENAEVKRNITDEDKLESRWTENGLRDLAQNTTDAATDTTIATVLSFIVALAVNRDVFDKAQAEIDQMCDGAQKAQPESSDIDKLIYLKACILEVDWRISISSMLTPD